MLLEKTPPNVDSALQSYSPALGLLAIDGELGSHYLALLSTFFLPAAAGCYLTKLRWSPDTESFLITAAGYK